jgi:hypothetical protein
MAQDIVGSLFGATPQQVQADITNPIFNRAQQFAQLNPMQQAQYGIYSGGAMLGQGIGGLLGGEDPRLVQARQMQQVKDYAAQNNIDVNSPEGLMQLAQYANSIKATEGAMYLGQQAQQMKKTQVETRRTEALATREESRNAKLDRMEQELQALPPDATQEQIISIVTKYGDANTILREYSDRAEKQAKLAAEGGIGAAGKPGPVNKNGAYRDIDGTIFGAPEMKDIRQEFDAAQKVMNDLNKITPKDVSDAQSMVVDPESYKLTKKAFGSEKMISAQTKLAASQLLQQIASLPKGSASDKDMEAAQKDFPGYQDAVALAKWVNRTKQKLQDRIDKISMQFNFKPTTVSSGYIDVDGSGRSLQGFVVPEQQQQAPAQAAPQQPQQAATGWRLK